MDFLIHISSAVIAEGVTYPVLTFRTKYMTSQTNMLHLLKTSKGYYSGLSWALLNSGIGFPCRYLAFDLLNGNEEGLPLYKRVLLGFLAGILTTPIIHIPFAFSSYYQEDHKKLSKEIKSKGIKIIFRGMSSTMIRNAVGNSLFIPINSYVLDKLSYLDDQSRVICSAFISGVAGSIVLHPIENKQIRHTLGHSHWLSGIRQYYRGFSLSLLRIVPYYLITFYLVYLGEGI